MRRRSVLMILANVALLPFIYGNLRGYTALNQLLARDIPAECSPSEYRRYLEDEIASNVTAGTDLTYEQFKAIRRPIGAHISDGTLPLLYILVFSRVDNRYLVSDVCKMSRTLGNSRFSGVQLHVFADGPDSSPAVAALLDELEADVGIIGHTSGMDMFLEAPLVPFSYVVFVDRTGRVEYETRILTPCDFPVIAASLLRISRSER